MKEYFSSKNIENGYKEKLINFIRYRNFENKSFIQQNFSLYKIAIFRGLSHVEAE